MFKASLKYIFLFNDLIVETEVKKWKGENIKKLKPNELYEKFYSIDDMNELEDCEFVLTNQWRVHVEWLINPSNPTSEVPFWIHIFMPKSNGKAQYVKYSIETQDEKDVWKSVIADQIIVRRVTLENKLKRHDNAMKNETRHSKTVSVSQVEYDPSKLKYKSEKTGELIKSGDCIKAIMKDLKNRSADKGKSIDEFFKEIEEREMTEENKKHYKMVVNEMSKSETVHLNGLKILQEVYLKPIIELGGENGNKAKAIDGQVKQLIMVHQKFQTMMEEGVKEAEKTLDSLPFFGKKFVQNLQKLYSLIIY